MKKIKKDNFKNRAVKKEQDAIIVGHLNFIYYSIRDHVPKPLISELDELFEDFKYRMLKSTKHNIYKPTKEKTLRDIALDFFVGFSQLAEDRLVFSLEAVLDTFEIAKAEEVRTKLGKPPLKKLHSFQDVGDDFYQQLFGLEVQPIVIKV